ncbi:MAG TPA: PilN domain-containing protein [bacterium]|nr:PilN domain-containing protein [bacterium]
MRHNLIVRDTTRPIAIVLWALVALVSMLTVAQAMAVRNEVHTLRLIVSAAQARVTQLQARAAEADARVAPFQQASEIAAQLGMDTIEPTMLRQVEPQVPTDIWFTDVTMSRDTIGVDGRGLSLESIAKTAEVLRNTAGIASVQVTVVTKAVEGWYSFHIVAHPQSPSKGGPRP